MATEHPLKRKPGRPKGTGYGAARQLSHEEIEALTQPLSLRDRALVWLCLGGGMRVSEPCHLRMGHLGSDGSILVEKTTAKSRKARRVYLSGQARVHFHAYLATRQHALATDYCFVSRNGGALTPNWACRLVSGIMLRAGVYGASSHSLRRTHAMGLQAQHSDLAVIKTQLGHASIATTEVYLAQTPPDHREEVERLTL